jgi:hypothetical protein
MFGTTLRIVMIASFEIKGARQSANTRRGVILMPK